MTLKCEHPNCGAEFTPKNPGGTPQRFCSEKCRRDNWSRQRAIKAKAAREEAEKRRQTEEAKIEATKRGLEAFLRERNTRLAKAPRAYARRYPVED